MMPLYTDTTCNKDADIITWEGVYNLLEEEKPTRVCRLKDQSLNLHVRSCTK